METKRCGRCDETKPLSGFYRNAARGDGLSGYCSGCQRATDDKRERRDRAELLVLLGGTCKHCGFDNPMCLQVDHVNGGGNKIRKAGGHYGASALLRALREDPDGYQLLCANCNIIKRMVNGEHVGERQYNRVILTERTFAPRKRPIKSYRGVDEKAKELIAVADSRRAEMRAPSRLPAGSWSRYYLRCVGCLGTERHHAANGLCFACYQQVQAYKKRQESRSEQP